MFCRASITSLIELRTVPPRHALDELARIERELRGVHSRLPCGLGFRARVLDAGEREIAGLRRVRILRKLSALSEGSSQELMRDLGKV